MADSSDLDELRRLVESLERDANELRLSPLVPLTVKAAMSKLVRALQLLEKMHG